VAGLVKFTWRGQEFSAKAIEAFQDSQQILHRRIVQAISDPVWAWPKSPSPRDIVDTGQLRASQSVRSLAPNIVEHANSAEYALAVHEGYATRHGFTAPPRPFMTKTLEDFDLPGVFAKLYRGAP
jgi:hypothetical protein